MFCSIRHSGQQSPSISTLNKFDQNTRMNRPKGVVVAVFVRGMLPASSQQEAALKILCHKNLIIFKLQLFRFYVQFSMVHPQLCSLPFSSSTGTLNCSLTFQFVEDHPLNSSSSTTHISYFVPYSSDCYNLTRPLSTDKCPGHVRLLNSDSYSPTPALRRTTTSININISTPWGVASK